MGAVTPTVAVAVAATGERSALEDNEGGEEEGRGGWLEGRRTEAMGVGVAVAVGVEGGCV